MGDTRESVEKRSRSGNEAEHCAAGFFEWSWSHHRRFAACPEFDSWRDAERGRCAVRDGKAGRLLPAGENRDARQPWWLMGDWARAARREEVGSRRKRQRNVRPDY